MIQKVGFWILLALVYVIIPVPQAWGDDRIDASLLKACRYLQRQPSEAYPWTGIALEAAGCGGTSVQQLSDLPPHTPTTTLAREVIAGSLDGSDWVPEAAMLLKGLQLPSGKFADTVAGTGESLVNAHVWAILALTAAGEEIADPRGALTWLVRHQRTDGGFAYDTLSFESDVDMTAAALSAMNALGLKAGDPPVAQGLGFLRAAQLPNGGFASWGQESSESTASVLQILVALGIDPQDQDWRKPGGNILEFLFACQQADGAFASRVDGEGNVIATAQAVLALGDLQRGRPYWTSPKREEPETSGSAVDCHLCALATAWTLSVSTPVCQGGYPRVPVSLAALLTRSCGGDSFDWRS